MNDVACPLCSSLMVYDAAWAHWICPGCLYNRSEIERVRAVPPGPPPEELWETYVDTKTGARMERRVQ